MTFIALFHGQTFQAFGALNLKLESNPIVISPALTWHMVGGAVLSVTTTSGLLMAARREEARWRQVTAAPGSRRPLQLELQTKETLC